MNFKRQKISDIIKETESLSSLPSILKFSQYRKGFNFKDTISSNLYNDIGTIGNQFYSFSYDFPDSDFFFKLNETLKKLKDSNLSKSYLFKNFNIFKLNFNSSSEAMSNYFTDFFVICFNSSGEKINQDAVGIIKSYYSKEVFVIIPNKITLTKITALIYPKTNIYEESRLFLEGIPEEDNSFSFKTEKNSDFIFNKESFSLSDVEENLDLFLKNGKNYFKLDNSLVLLDFSITKNIIDINDDLTQGERRVLVSTQTDIYDSSLKDDYFKKVFRNKNDIIIENKKNFYNETYKIVININPLVKLNNGEKLFLSSKNNLNYFSIENYSIINNEKSFFLDDNINTLFYGDKYLLFGINKNGLGKKLIEGVDYFITVKDQTLKISRFYGKIGTNDPICLFDKIEIIPFFDNKRMINVAFKPISKLTGFNINAYLYMNKIYGYNTKISSMEIDIFQNGNYKQDLTILGTFLKDEKYELIERDNCFSDKSLLDTSLNISEEDVNSFSNFPFLIQKNPNILFSNYSILEDPGKNILSPFDSNNTGYKDEHEVFLYNKSDPFINEILKEDLLETELYFETDKEIPVGTVVFLINQYIYDKNDITIGNKLFKKNLNGDYIEALVSDVTATENGNDVIYTVNETNQLYYKEISVLGNNFQSGSSIVSPFVEEQNGFHYLPISSVWFGNTYYESFITDWSSQKYFYKKENFEIIPSEAKNDQKNYFRLESLFENNEIDNNIDILKEKLFEYFKKFDKTKLIEKKELQSLFIVVNITDKKNFKKLPEDAQIIFKDSKVYDKKNNLIYIKDENDIFILETEENYSPTNTYYYKDIVTLYIKEILEEDESEKLIQTDFVSKIFLIDDEEYTIILLEKNVNDTKIKIYVNNDDDAIKNNIEENIFNIFYIN